MGYKKEYIGMKMSDSVGNGDNSLLFISLANLLPSDVNEYLLPNLV